MGFGEFRTFAMAICAGLALQVLALQPSKASDLSSAFPAAGLEDALRHENAMVSAVSLSRVAVLPPCAMPQRPPRFLRDHRR